MAGRKLAVNTTAVDEDGRMVTFPAGTVVSAGVAAGITNLKAWGDEPDDDGQARPAKKAPAKKAASSKSEQ